MKRIFGPALIVLAVLLSVSTLSACGKKTAPSHPWDSFLFDTSLMRLIVPENWELTSGDSRTVDFAFAEGVRDRRLSWHTSDESVAAVDEWGRVTALRPGKADIVAANPEEIAAKASLTVVSSPTKIEGIEGRRVDYAGKAAGYGGNLQKIVSRYPAGDGETPPGLPSGPEARWEERAVSADGAVWTVTEYGVLRTDGNAENGRDGEQRFMGDRYFMDNDTSGGRVLGIMPDGGNGIWTKMDAGITHIEMIPMSGAEKAALMSGTTDRCVSRRGMVSEAYLQPDGTWKGNESDNDGLWTSMYGAGELMRYAVLKKDPGASPEDVETARRSALKATEAVLLLSNICMRTGTTKAYVRYQPNGYTDEDNGRFLSREALVKGGDPSLNRPMESPAEAFERTRDSYYGKTEEEEYEDEEEEKKKPYFLAEDYLRPLSEEDWKDPRTAPEGTEFALRTRNLEGYVARTYSLRDENNPADGYVHWSLYGYADGDRHAEGVSERDESERYYFINGENLRGVRVDASGEIPQRLWDDLIGDGYTVNDIVYKGDTSADEIIGHLFLYKLAFDILGPEDPEIREIIAYTMDRFARHLSDNGYAMVDGSGQPGTWSKFNRDFFYNSSQLGGAPLTAAVLLSAFKVAAYVTGNRKWEDEYRMAALDASYEYARLTTQYSDQCDMVMVRLTETLDLDLGNKNMSRIVMALVKDALIKSLDQPLPKLLRRLFLNYSDEEMAMLAFYLLFQLETDEELLSMYRTALDGWWESIQYSENPLWYYIYQLAYPDEEKTDAYGNSLVETAAWSLSRHPVDTRKYGASSPARDDLAELDISDFLDVGEGAVLCYDVSGGDPLAELRKKPDLLKLLNTAPLLPWAVAAPDERSLHKYNHESYELDGNRDPDRMEGATTFTLPFWLGVYHGMLSLD